MNILEIMDLLTPFIFIAGGGAFSHYQSLLTSRIEEMAKENGYRRKKVDKLEEYIQNLHEQLQLKAEYSGTINGINMEMSSLNRELREELNSIRKREIALIDRMEILENELAGLETENITLREANKALQDMVDISDKKKLPNS